MIVERQGSTVTCPICHKSCRGGGTYLRTGKFAADIKGCDHYDGWELDKKRKVMKHYFYRNKKY
jgi:hypothetical protein